MFHQLAAPGARRRLAAACAAALAWPAAHAASTAAAVPADSTPAAAAEMTASGKTLDTVKVTAQRAAFAPDTPGVVEALTREQIDSHVNVTTEDALKYAPNLMVRRRYIGDRNSVFAGRDFNELQSARGLVYADGILLSNLLGSSYSYPPRWSLIQPDDIARVDVLYGPFSALYPGNAIGSTVQITTHKPQRLEASVSTQFFTQRYRDGYGFADSFGGNHQSARIADRVGRFWYALSLDRLENDSQPMQYASPNGAFDPRLGAPVPVTGAVSDIGPNGRPRTIVGAQTIERTEQLNETLRFGYAFTDHVDATVTLGHWENHYRQHGDTFLRDAAGNPVYGGNVSFGGRNYTVSPGAFAPQTGDQENWLYGLGLDARLASGWKLSATASAYEVSRDVLRSASGAPPGAWDGGPGTVFHGDGTGWRTVDLRAESPDVRGHRFSFGYHFDTYFLRNATYNTADWQNAVPTTLVNRYRGNTRTQALYAQDAWRVAPGWLATLGLRYERWDAYGGELGGATATLGYAERGATAFSPKLSLEWQPASAWRLRLSFATGTRFPTVAELFQGTISNNAIVNNNPNLQPEKAIDWDFTAERDVGFGVVRASVFQSDLRNSIYSQTTLAGASTYTNVSNVDRVRVRGVELAFSGQDVALKGLDVDANVSATNAQTLADAANPNYVGARWPRIPRMRANLLASYRFDEHWMTSVGVRYSGRQYNALDNSDMNPGVYGGTSSFMVVDLKARYRFDRHWLASFGIDNVTDRRYYVFHPYPGRTFYGELKWSL
ncbi:TonB-dependent receptor [Burkholderia pseudomallei]|uniref:TonB-dependent receptor n=1 Tax=Burkholderia pseudomallei TaxID=28450 RepID=UPI00014F8CBB|nr:TonB-dependent receptor [Burkholderia pseudomallei]AGR72998.1 tonB dependent receptor family protein [Burkholderia pseudomallei MSHR305]AHE28050.1 tonB dependent receptor family protein [Burkholderia pseudomallei NCTC 13178]AHK64238.1 tonB dependent receptor family protein [Burkholderia pseudomallei MSHR520]AIP79956.1 tonB dependent receptor family protein [Burkholderia pseudomallei]APZ19292.1 TonB-dependent receptor [Burkholderia pseudomallei]